MTIILLIVFILLVLIPGIIISVAYFNKGVDFTDILARFMVIVQSPIDFIRNFSGNTLTVVRASLSKTLNSVGISGEHYFQRIIGAFLFTACFLLSNIVSFVTNSQTISGFLSSSIPDEEKLSLAQGVMNFLMVNPEELITLELVAMIVLFAAMLLDIIGITHLSAFLSKERLNKWLRLSVGIILSVMTVYSVYLFFETGVTRANVVFAESNENSSEVVNTGDEELSTNSDNQNEYSKSARTILIGIPIIAAVGDALSALGILPMLVLISVPIFIALIIPIWIISSISNLLSTLLNYIYNFYLSILNLVRQQNNISQDDNMNSTSNNTASDQPDTSVDDSNISKDPEVNPDSQTDTNQGSTDNNNNDKSNGNNNGNDNNNNFESDDRDFNPFNN